MNTIIGILGGMGPRATVEFERLLIERLTGTDQELPTIITINDGSIPDRTDFILGRGIDPVPKLQHNLDLLEDLGASIICMPCNTASTAKIMGRLETFSSILIDLPAAVVSRVREENLKKVYLLSTRGTLTSRLYQDLFMQEAIDYIEPDYVMQQKVSSLISAIKQGQTTKANRQAISISAILARSGCDSVLLGCTELTMARAHLVPSGVSAIDTLVILADACVIYNLSRGELSYESR